MFLFCKRTKYEGNVPGRAAAVTVEIISEVGAETDFIVDITLRRHETTAWNTGL